MREYIDIYESGKDLMICELDKIVQKQEMSPNTLEYIYKIVDIIKDLDEVISNEDIKYGGYSQRSGSSYYGNNSGRMYGQGSSYRGRYNDMGSSYSGRNSSTTEMLDHLYKAHDTASSDEERKRIKRMIDEIENSK